MTYLSMIRKWIRVHVHAVKYFYITMQSTYLPLKRNTMFVVFIHHSFALIAKGWWVGANCIQGVVNKEFGVQILCKLSAVTCICFPHLFVSSLH